MKPPTPRFPSRLALALLSLATTAASAQTLNAGSNALLMGLGMWMLGPVFAAHGGLAYLTMAALGTIAALAALWLRHLVRHDDPAPPA